MKSTERIILSPLLYPLWRIAWIELAFFQFCRMFNKTEQAAFNFYNFGFDPEAIVRFAVSTYVYYDPRFDPIRQADKVIAVLAPWKDRIRRVWLDLEFSWSGSYSAPQHWKTFRDRINAAGYKTGWYTRATWWNSRVGSFAAEFATDPVWAAQYNNSLTLIPKGWTKAMIWQNGTPVIGYAAGASSAEIDNDIWNDEFSFYDEWSAVIQPLPVEPPPGDEMTTYYLTAIGDPTKVFSDYQGTSPVSQIAKGTSFTSRAKTTTTYYITNPKVGYVKFSQVRLDNTVPDAPPPPPVDPPPATGKQVTVVIDLEGYKPKTLTGALEPDV